MSAQPGGSFSCPDCPPNAHHFGCAEELESHVAGDHLDMCPYECERCRFAKYPTEYALVEHCRRDHGLSEFHIRFKFSDDLERKRAELKRRMRVALTPYLNGCLVGGVGPTQQMVLEVNKVESGYSNPSSQCNGSSPAHLVSLEDLAQQNISQALQDVINGHASTSMQQQMHVDETCVSGNQFGQNTQSPLDLGNESSDYSNFVAQECNDDDSSGSGKKPREVVTCQICGLKVSNQRSSLVYHTNTKHCQLDLYQCRQCSKTWRTIAKSDVLKHVKAVHNGDESMIVDNRKALSAKLRQWTSKCFPPKEKKKAPLSGGLSPSHNVNSPSATATAVLSGVLEGAGFGGHQKDGDLASGSPSFEDDEDVDGEGEVDFTPPRHHIVPNPYV